MILKFRYDRELREKQFVAELVYILPPYNRLPEGKFPELEKTLIPDHRIRFILREGTKIREVDFKFLVERLQSCENSIEIRSLLQELDSAYKDTLRELSSHKKMSANRYLQDRLGKPFKLLREYLYKFRKNFS